MSLIKTIDYDQLNEYAKIPISFTVNSEYEVKPPGKYSSEYRLKEKPVSNSYFKNYDDYESPLDWISKWDLKWNSDNWGFFLAINDSCELIGGAAVAVNIPGMQMCEGKEDLAILWDIRVHPDHRGKGAGKLMFNAAIIFALSKNCTSLKIETQNTNVAACKFYKSMGCALKKVTRHAYSEYPDEIQFFWYKNLGS